MNRAELMRKIQETGFALYDLTLFLDTHPQNQMALDYFTYRKTIPSFRQSMR